MIARRMRNFPTMSWRHPFAEMEQISRQMDLLTNTMFGIAGWRLMPARNFPAVNVSEDSDKYYVRAELPGIKADEINLQVKGKNLSIAGERNLRSEGDNMKYYRREREAGSFSRIIGLPGDIDADSVKAKLANGILEVTVAKSEASKPKQITVN